MNTKQIPLRPGGLELTEIAASKAALTKNSCVLDIGCGTGASLLYIRKKYGCHVFGVDYSEKAIAAARASLLDANTFGGGHATADTLNLDSKEAFTAEASMSSLLTADASSLPFSDSSFDLVLMECTLTLFEDPFRALAEATRVLKPGGMLFISALTQQKPSGQASRTAGLRTADLSSADASTADASTADASTADASTPPASSVLVKSGLLHMDSLCKQLSDLGFHHISCTERNDVLVQFAADVIFTYGSLENYIKEASACIDGCVLNCNISPKESGYAYFLATKS